MQSFLIHWADATWSMVVDSAFLFLVGVTLAGFISLVMNRENVARYVRDNGMKSVFRAALIGIPLPLCSCSVLPVADQLRRSGASKAATASFLISTPESGVDSILLTYSLTDPLLTVARPVTAFITALVAGFGETLSASDNRSILDTPAATMDCGPDCTCAVGTPETPGQSSVAGRIWSALRYAYTDLLRDLAPYLLLGFVLAGLLEAVLGPDMLAVPESVKTGWVGYAAAIVVGLPMYICASSSTPLAAVLLSAGFSPGAILVFLMVGPATNVASLVVLKRILGGWSTLRYVFAIIIVSVLGGVALDHLYGVFDVAVRYSSTAADSSAGWFYIGCGLLLGGMIVVFSLQALFARVRSFGLKQG